MRLPSLGDVVTASVEAAKRFPFVIGAGAVAAYAAIGLVEHYGTDPGLLRLLTTASLGLPLFFGLTVLGERSRTPSARWTIPAVGLLAQADFWYAWPYWTAVQQGLHFVQLSATFHLFVAFAPFIGRREPNAFWQYNRVLFIRFLTTALYTGALWLGIAGALLALDRLLGVKVPAEGYARLWMVLSFVFNPWFFVGGLPTDIGALEQVTDYPKGLRMFTQYVLVPIVAVYLIILTVYFGKVVFTQVWPKGWIGYLVSGVAGVGIFSWLLVHPLEERAEHAWVKPFTRGFYVALMPAIAMLWLAVWKRVNQYGITEERYFLIVLSVWLAAVAVYYAFSRSRNIKLIPATLCAIGVLSFAGPWSASSVSRWSQTRRLETVLSRNGMLDNGKMRVAPGPVPDSAVMQISAGLRYLLEVHSAQSVRPMLGDSIARRVGALTGGNMGDADAGARTIATAAGLHYTSRSDGAGSSRFYSYHAIGLTEATRIEGYTYAIRFNGVSLRDSLVVVPGTYVRVIEEPAALIVTRDGARLIDFPLQPMADSIEEYRRRLPATQMPQIPAHLMTVESRTGTTSVLLRLNQITGTMAPKPRVTSLTGDLFLKLP